MRLTIPTERQRESLLVLVRAFDRQIVADALHVDIPGLARALAGRPVHAGSPLLSVTSTAWDRCRAVAAASGVAPTEPPPAPAPVHEDAEHDPPAPMNEERWAAWRRIRTEWANHVAGVCGPGCPLKSKGGQ